MRIISGIFKSRKINSPPVSRNDKVNSIRPTSDRARETLFDILSNYIDFDRMNCLDLYAGTGAFGFECLSRGAGHAAFVDKSFTSIKLVKKTSEDFDITPLISVYRLDSIRFLNEYQGEYDIIFAYPPYNYNMNEKLVKLVLEKSITCFVLETGNDIETEYNSEVYKQIKRRTGSAYFHIFLNKDILNL